MSGITPLLDTLLHQVLGKRVDTAPPRDLTEPVRPVAPGEGPRALQSDSRLGGQRPAVPLLPNAPTSHESLQSTRGDALPSPPPASTQTHFSPSARTIADVLMRFPAPPSVLSTTAPLMTADESPSASALAERLQANVRNSGLFYESHLGRWYRGEVSRQQLEREPQMLNTPRATPVPGSALSPAPGLMRGEPSLPTATTPVPGQAENSQTASGQSPAAHAASRYVATESLYAPGARGEASSTAREAVTHDVRVEGREAAAQERSSALLTRPTASEPVHDSLQGVVRHQLELLVTPILRWEGDVWSGIFMALMVHLPATAQREGEASAQEEREQQQETWHSEIRLTVPQLGEVHAALWLQERGLQEQGLQERGVQERSVRLQLQSRDESALEVLQAGVPQLEQRLHNAGLTQVLIDVRALSGAEEGRGDAGAEA